MLSRQAALDVLERAYRARVAGDREALRHYWAEGAHFELAGDQERMDGVTLCDGAPMKTIGALIDTFKLDDIEVLDAVMEGNRLAARSRLTIATAGGAPAHSQVFDLIDFDDDGKIRSFVQFADTALIRDLAAEAST